MFCLAAAFFLNERSIRFTSGVSDVLESSDCNARTLERFRTHSLFLSSLRPLVTISVEHTGTHVSRLQTTRVSTSSISPPSAPPARLSGAHVLLFLAARRVLSVVEWFCSRSEERRSRFSLHKPNRKFASSSRNFCPARQVHWEISKQWNVPYSCYRFLSGETIPVCLSAEKWHLSHRQLLLGGDGRLPFVPGLNTLCHPWSSKIAYTHTQTQKQTHTHTLSGKAPLNCITSPTGSGQSKTAQDDVNAVSFWIQPDPLLAMEAFCEWAKNHFDQKCCLPCAHHPLLRMGEKLPLSLHDRVTSGSHLQSDINSIFVKSYFDCYKDTVQAS